MKLIYPKEFKIGNKTLVLNVRYVFGRVTGNLFIGYPSEIFVESPKDDSSLRSLVNSGLPYEADIS